MFYRTYFPHPTQEIPRTIDFFPKKPPTLVQKWKPAERRCRGLPKCPTTQLRAQPYKQFRRHIHYSAVVISLCFLLATE